MIATTAGVVMERSATKSCPAPCVGGRRLSSVGYPGQSGQMAGQDHRAEAREPHATASATTQGTVEPPTLITSAEVHVQIVLMQPPAVSNTHAEKHASPSAVGMGALPWARRGALRLRRRAMLHVRGVLHRAHDDAAATRVSVPAPASLVATTAALGTATVSTSPAQGRWRSAASNKPGAAGVWRFLWRYGDFDEDRSERGGPEGCGEARGIACQWCRGTADASRAPLSVSSRVVPDSPRDGEATSGNTIPVLLSRRVIGCR